MPASARVPTETTCARLARRAPERARVAALATVVLAGVLRAETAAAQDVWSTPYPGVRQLTRTTPNPWRIHALVVDLCAPGVSLRATRSAERTRTVSSFGRLVSAQAAINGDFFLAGSGYRTVGLAVGAGERWADTRDPATHGFVAFGARRARVSPEHEAVDPPEPWMREVVGFHPQVLDDGRVNPGTGDPLCEARHPRTALGLSADQATLYMVVVDGRSTSSIGMTCGELGTLMRGLGAHDAVNFDGGGSSAMWVASRGVVSRPSDGTERTVANHLAVFARGTGPAVHCPNRAPVGFLDGADCEAIFGWAQDPDAPDAPISAHVYIGGPAGDMNARGYPIVANRRREDLCRALGSCNHGFRMLTPRGFMDGTERPVYAYGIDSEGGPNRQLANAPRMLRCEPPMPPLPATASVRRHVPSAEVFAAWRFDWSDIARLPDAVLDAIPAGPPLDAQPRLVRTEGDPRVYLREYEIKRHVPDPAAMDAWRFEWDAIASEAPAQVEGYATGEAILGRPFLARGSGDAVYLIDHPPPLWAELVDDTLPEVLQPGETREVTLRFRNRGTVTWLPDAVALAPAEPRDADSPLCDPSSWRSCQRVADVSGSVAPGETGTFHVRVRAPREASGGAVRVCWGLVYRDRHWFGDPGQGGPADDALCRAVGIGQPSAPLDDGGQPVRRDGGADAGGEPGGEVSGGCGCTAPGRDGARHAGLVGLLAAALLARRPRRRRG